MNPVIALVGCPNCGKTAMFNALTGARQKVANYPGVTVERKTGSFSLPRGQKADLVDLPGTYSLRGRSPDERITRDAILGRLQDERLPQAIICVADATNLRLVLRLILELKRVGIPLIVALNMADKAARQGSHIDKEKLAQELGVPVVSTVAIRQEGLDDLLRQAEQTLATAQANQQSWSEPTSEEIRQAHAEAERLLKACSFRSGDERATREIDRILLHPFFGTAILLFVLFLVFQAIFTWASPVMDGIKATVDFAGAFVASHMQEGMLRSLLVDGVIAGVGSVVVFLPQILILFFFLILLEDSGYMARAAFLMDRIMAGAGLHGRAMIPLLSSFACAIPGIMSARVIENRVDRLTTIMVAPLMTCSARIPVYTLIIAAFIPKRDVWGGISLQGLVMFSLYAFGILSALAVSWVMKTFVWRQPAEPFLMEMPGYKWPTLKNISLGLWQRATIFLRRAGTIILALMIVIWFLASFPGAPAGATEPAIHFSVAGMLGRWLEPVLHPIGFNWQIAVALIPGMAAREVAVGALATVYALSSVDGESTRALQTALTASWPLPTALSLLAWYVFAPQCASTLAVVKRETNSWKWPWVMFVYMTAMAYAAAYITFRVASRILGA